MGAPIGRRTSVRSGYAKRAPDESVRLRSATLSAQTDYVALRALRVVVARIPERDRRGRLVRHAVRVADQLDVRAERIVEVVDRLPSGGTVGQRHRSEQLRPRA